MQGGATWGDLDAATQEHGLAVTGGRVSDTGVGGLALGSGSGWLERMYGVTCESLLSAEVVTADGSVVRASADENPDLFWGLRGGGGNFGVVTEFEFRLHPVGPIVMGGMLVFPRERAREVLRVYRDFMEQAPDEVGGGAGADHRAARGVRPRGGCAASRRWASSSATSGRSRTASRPLRPLREATGPGDRHGAADAVRRAAADARRREPARDPRVLQGRLAERAARRGDRRRSSSRRSSCRHRSGS